MKSTSVRFLAHRGQSMEPLFRGGDILSVSPVSTEDVTPGDVIAFCRSAGPEYTVHRVIARTNRGFKTRGDNMDSEDPWVVAPAEVAGRVRSLRRGDRRIAVSKGRRGRVVSFLFRLRRKALRGLSPLLSPLYRSLSALSPLPRLLPGRFRPRVVTFGCGDRAVRKVLLGSVRAATYNRDTEAWEIRRPFRLLIDESRLPARFGGESP